MEIDYDMCIWSLIWKRCSNMWNMWNMWNEHECCSERRGGARAGAGAGAAAGSVAGARARRGNAILDAPYTLAISRIMVAYSLRQLALCRVALMEPP